MKISIQDTLLPGKTWTEKFDVAEELGVEGVELVAIRAPIYDRVEELETVLRGRSLQVAAVCGQTTFDWLEPDPTRRKASIEETRKNLAVCGHFGAVGHIMPPIFGPPRLPDLSPFKDAITLEKELLVHIIQDLGQYAEEQGTRLLLEPLNRYEQHLLRRQADGVAIIQQAGDPAGVALLSDFFHMHIEETDTPAAFRQAGKRYVAHIHVADNTRQQPGTGDIDWQAGLQALRDIGYDGYLSFECGLQGDAKEALRSSVRFLRDRLDSIA
jgi:sugar phosphate isomerase/epimerase